MNDINTFLADVPTEDTPVNLGDGEQKESETPAESPTENKPTEEAPSSDGANNSQNEEENLPFHKHPRWKEMYNKNKNLEETISSLREELETKISNISKTATNQDDEPIPDDFVRLYGDNKDAYRLWQKQQNDLAERIKADIASEFERKEQASQRALAEGERYVEDSLQALEDEGKKFDRNELMKFMLDFKEKYGALPSDANDNIDFARGYDLMVTMKGDKQNVAKSKARKDIASFSGDSGENRGESAKKDYLTNIDLRNAGWDTLIGS